MSIFHLFLWVTAAIWGFAFVAQSIGMDSLGPYSFNATRFILASVSMLPLFFLIDFKKSFDYKLTLKAGTFAGIILFCGATLQQVGLQYTTTANAGFITTMYVVFVPLAGLFLRHHIERHTWLGITLAIVGLYTLTIGPSFSIQKGDAIELIGVFFWTAHVLVIDYYSRKVPIITCTLIQLIVIATLSSFLALYLEEPSIAGVKASLLPLLYAGVASSAIAYSLQMLGQKQVPPSSSALILSTEALFAAVGGWLIMDQTLTMKDLMGCSLIFVGMLVSQWPRQNKSDNSSAAIAQ